MTNIMHTARIKMSNVMLLQSRQRVHIFFARVVQCDRIKHFAPFGSILYDFSLKNGEKHAFLFKNGLTSCYL